MTARSHVTKREAQAVADFATEVLYALHMPRWRVLVMEEPADEDDLASIATVEGKYTAQVYLSTDWMKHSEEQRRNTVVHEMLHLLHFRVDHVLEDALRPCREGERDQLERRYRRETELMVDHLAEFLADTHSLREAWDKAHGR